MPSLSDPDPIWATGRDGLSNEVIAGRRIAARHLIELLEGELKRRKLPGQTRVPSDLENMVQRTAERIRQHGLTPGDNQLISGTTSLGIVVIKEGLVSAQRKLEIRKYNAYAELIWLVRVTTTPAHALLLVLAIGKQKLIASNLRAKSILVSFIAQKENALACTSLKSAARSLLSTGADTVSSDVRLINRPYYSLDMLPSSSPFLNLVVGNSSSELDINTERIHALWLYYADLPNDDVEKLVIEYRHLIQLFQILLELPEIVPPNFELGQKVQQKAQQIQQQGLSPTDRSLIEEATGRNLGITVIEKGLVSAQGLGWKQKSHAEFVWLVSHITTAAHGILLVLAIDRPDLETINLRQKTMLAVFMKQRENILSCAALESTARSLYTTRDT